MREKSKPKFDKIKCLRCKYHSQQYRGYTTKSGNRFVSVSCNYAGITGETCLKPAENYSVVDTRGNDYNNCMLFSEGKRVEPENSHFVILR